MNLAPLHDLHIPLYIFWYSSILYTKVYHHSFRFNTHKILHSSHRSVLTVLRPRRISTLCSILDFNNTVEWRYSSTPTYYYLATTTY